MPELSKTAQQCIDLTGAWNERKRTFERLADLRLTDKEREAAIAAYVAAAAAFDKARAALTKN